MIEKFETIADLSGFLSISASTLTGFVPNDYYKAFQVPKPGKNEKRLIETPVGIMRTWLDSIADELQNLYRKNNTDAAYSFVRSYKTDTDKRNIYTNAQRRLGKNYLLNIDLDNFLQQQR